MSDRSYKLLCSGHSNSVVDSLATLAQIFEQIERMGQDKKRQRPITLLVGSGVNPVTVNHVTRSLLPYYLSEIHLTGGRWVEGGMWQRPANMGMGVPGNEWNVWRTSEEAIRDVRAQMDELLVKWQHGGLS